MNKNNLIADEIKSDYFFYHKDDKSFSQDISSLKGFNPLRQLWNDACDQGFVMKSERTGKKVAFYFSHTDMDGSDTAGWNFKIVEEYNMTQEQKRMTVLIINT